MFKNLYILIIFIIINHYITINFEFEAFKTSNSSYFKFIPLSINIDFIILDKYNEKINKTKIEIIKKIIINAKLIYESLISVNSQYHIFTPQFNLGKICKNEKLSNIRAIGFYTNLIIFPIIENHDKYPDGLTDYYVCGFYSKDRRPLLATLTLSQRILYINEEEIFKEIMHSLFHILGFRQNARENSGMKNLCSGNTFENLELKKVAKKYNGVYSSMISLFNNNKKYLHWTESINYDIMSEKRKRILNFNEYSLRYLQNLKWYRVNLDICGCSLKGECSFGSLPYELYINKNTLKLYCYRNQVFERKCIIDNNIFYLKQTKYYHNNLYLNFSMNYFKIEKCRNYDVQFDFNENLLYKGLLNKQNFTGQEITLVSPIINSNCKCHLKTIFLYNRKDEEYNKYVENHYELKKMKIYDLNKIVYGSFTTYNNKHSESFRDTLKFNNILLLNNEYTPNILFSILNRDHSFELLSHLNEFSIFRGSQNLYKLGNKDSAYIYFAKFKKKFPKDFDYMVESYIMPNQKSIVELKFKNYIQKENDLWLCKKSNGSLGEGIYFLKNYQDFLKCNQVISKYIHNPHLYKRRKYHIRLYNFISSFIPLIIYIYKEGQVMSASHEYKYDLKNILDKQSFLTNAHINFGKEGYNEDISIKDLKDQIIKEGGNWDFIWEQIKDICIKIIITIYDEEYNKLNIFTKYNVKSFMFLGLDIMIDHNFKVWFLEANDAAHMEEYDKVNEKNKIGISTDIFNILGLIPFDHSNGIPLEEKKCIFQNKIDEKINNAFCEFNRPQGNLERIFPIKKSLSYYSQFFIKNYKENNELWKYL